MAETDRLNPPPPHGFRLVKGSAYNTLSRAFVEMALHHPWVKDLISWSRDVESPDEYLWATLHHASDMVVPGSFTGRSKPASPVYATFDSASLVVWCLFFLNENKNGCDFFLQILFWQRREMK